MGKLWPYLGIAVAVAIGVALAPYIGALVAVVIVFLVLCVGVALVDRGWQRVMAAGRRWLGYSNQAR